MPGIVIMANLYEIRADYDRETIVVYQAYGSQIADAAIAEQKNCW